MVYSCRKLTELQAALLLSSNIASSLTKEDVYCIPFL